MRMATQARMTGSVFHGNIMYHYLKMALVPLIIINILSMSQFALGINLLVFDSRSEGRFVSLEARDIKSILEVQGRGDRGR